MYTPDGFMSAQLMRRGRPEFASGSWFDASDDELRAAASGYIAYSGPFHVGEKGTVTHRLGSLCTRTGSGSPRRSTTRGLDGRSDPVAGQGRLRLPHLAPHKNSDGVITASSRSS